jgi:hypothetical protein
VFQFVGHRGGDPVAELPFENVERETDPARDPPAITTAPASTTRRLILSAIVA